MPVQILFAGKAHPKDKAGQDLIKFIVEKSKEDRFRGRILFLDNYEIPLAKRLVHGADVWLNTPTRPLEASGTSGEKAVMNGVLHFSVLDGWWAEGYVNGAGWALQEKRDYDRQDFQDQLDAETIYSLIENEITPAFYKRDARGVPVAWVSMIQKSITKIAPEFTMNRMLRDYISRYYDKLYQKSLKLRENDYAMATSLASWKRKVLNVWNQIEVISVQFPDLNRLAIIIGNSYQGELVLDLKTLKPSELGVELVVGNRDSENELYRIINKQEFKLQKTEGSKAWYILDTTPTQPGVFDFGIRIFPKNHLFSNRQDLNIVRWI
jgi:glucan phosphorylase